MRFHRHLLRVLCAAPLVMIFSAVLPLGTASGVTCTSMGLPLLEGESALRCEQVFLPADYDSPADGEVALSVVVLEAVTPSASPVFILTGGPGSSAIDTYVDLLSSHPFRETRDIVIIEQRGTFYSTPSLFCDEVFNTSLALMADPPEPGQDLSARYLSAYEECFTRFAADGIDLSDYNSLNNARDIEGIRLALGYDQIVLYGSSYGTLLAQHYLRDYDTHVEAAILDAVVSPAINFITAAPAVTQAAFDRLFAACEADPTCSAVYPDLSETYRRTYLRLQDRPLGITLTDPATLTSYDTVFTGEDFRTFTFNLLYSGDILRFMPRIIRDISLGRMDEVIPIIEVLAFDRYQSDGMYYATVCAEDADYVTSDVDVIGLPIDMAEIEIDNARFIRDLCTSWPFEMLPPIVDQGVVTDVPVLLLSGAYDPITTASYAQDAAARMPNSQQVVFADGAHGNILNQPCAEGIVVGFLADPAAPLDVSCAASEGLDFFVGDDIIDVPVIARSLRGEPASLGQVIGLAAVALVLLGSWILLPIGALIQAVRRKKPAPQAEVGIEMTPPGPLPLRPLWARVASFLLLLLPAVLTAFLIGLIISYDRFAMMGDFRLLYGLPVEIRPLFFLPVLFILLSAVMPPLAIRLWRRKEAGLPFLILFALMILPALSASVLLITTNLALGLIF